MSSIGAVSSSKIQGDYMKLLVAQLQNQNPLEPLSNSEMASQLSQFAELEQLESMGSNFAEVLASTERTYANSLLGKEISFLTDTGTGEQALTSGVVEQVFNDLDGKVSLLTDGYQVSLKGIISVKEKE